MIFSESLVLSLHRLSRCGLFIIAASSVLFSATSLQATLLPAGGILYPAPAGPLPGGIPVDGPAHSPFATASFNGTLTSTVLTNDPTNPFGLNALTFTYQLQNAVASPGEIDRVTVSSFAGFLTDADYVLGTGVLAPTYIDRSAPPAGDTVGFQFSNFPLGPGTLQPGQTSDLLVVYTNSQQVQLTLANVIDNNVTRIASFAPITVIPEPSTLILAGLAAIGLVGFARRRRS